MILCFNNVDIQQNVLMKWQHCHALNNERADKHLLQPKMVDQIVVCLILSIVRSLLH